MSVFFGRSVSVSSFSVAGSADGRRGGELGLELGVEVLDLLVDRADRLLRAADVAGLLHRAPGAARGGRGLADRRGRDRLAAEERAEHRRADRDRGLHCPPGSPPASRARPSAPRGAGAPGARPASARTSGAACRPPRRAPRGAPWPMRERKSASLSPGFESGAGRRRSGTARASARGRSRSRSPCSRPRSSSPCPRPDASGSKPAPADGLRLALLDGERGRLGRRPVERLRRPAATRATLLGRGDAALRVREVRLGDSENGGAIDDALSGAAQRGEELRDVGRQDRPRPARAAGARGGGRRLRGRRLRLRRAQRVHQRLDLRPRQRAAQVRQRPARLEDLRARPRGRCSGGRRGCRAPASSLLHPRRDRTSATPRPRRPRARRARAPCRARSAAGRGTTCPCSRGPCSRGPPGSASRARRRGRTRGPASAASAAAPSTGGSRPAESSRRSRPCRGSRAGSSCPICARIQATIWLSSSVTKNIRSASPGARSRRSPRAACPSAVAQHRPDLERLAFEPRREARRRQQVVQAIASAKRSFAGKNDSRSTTPTFVNGGVWIRGISAARSRSSPFCQASAEDRRDEDVLAALERVGVDAEQRQQPGRRRGDPLAQRSPRRRARRGSAAPRRTAGSRPAGPPSSPGV